MHSGDSFLLLAGALGLFTVGYVAMSRYVSHTGVFYAYLARGLGRPWGLAGSLVALVAYNAIQICLYGLFGASMAGLWSSVLSLPWWAWSLLAWAVVAVLGVLHIGVNARVLAVVLVAEIAMIVLLDIASFTSPAQPTATLVPLQPGSLFVDGVGGRAGLRHRVVRRLRVWTGVRRGGPRSSVDHPRVVRGPRLPRGVLRGLVMGDGCRVRTGQRGRGGA